MPRRNVLVLITIIIIFVLAALVVFPVNQGVLGKKGVRLGLDLVGGIHLVIMEKPVLQWDPQLYRSLGLEPSEARIVVVKSPAAFRAAYEPIAAEIIMVDTPGAASANLRSMPWERIRRPIYPLDDIKDWR